MLSPELQQAVHDILARANAADTDGVELTDVLQIGTLFGSLNDVQHLLTRQHQRRLRLQMLTLRHLIPIWDHHMPGDHRLHGVLDAMRSLVMKRLSPEQAQKTRDHLWAHIDTYPHESPAIEHIHVSVYTTRNVLDMMENSTSAFGEYAPATHAAVALWYAAQADVAHQSTEKYQPNYSYRQYWRYWLTEIVPRAWFELPEDIK